MINDEIMATLPYQEYMDLRLIVLELKDRGILNEDNTLGLFSNDAEVAIFLASRFGLLTAKEAAFAVEKRFGEERRPAVAEVKRFWLKFRSCLISKVVE